MEQEQPTAASVPTEALPDSSGLTAEARDLLANADTGGVPAFMTDNLRRIAAENGVAIAPETTPNDVLDALRQRA